MKELTKRLVASAVLIPLGAWMGFQGARGIYNGLESIGWGTAKGQVTVSRIHSRQRPGSGPWDYWSELEIVYRYSFDGQEFSGNRVSFYETHREASSGKASSNHKTLKNRYPVGKEVLVRFDPEHPEDSVLEPGVTVGSGATVVFGAAFVCVGGLILFGVLKSG